VVQWGLTPESAKHDPTYHPKPAFLHAILAKHRNNLQPSKLFSHILRPRLDGISEPRLVRTLYEFTGDCFAITLKGPDGLPDSPNSMMDYQGVVMEDMKDLLGGKEVWEALVEISEKFVAIWSRPSVARARSGDGEIVGEVEAREVEIKRRPCESVTMMRRSRRWVDPSRVYISFLILRFHIGPAQVSGFINLYL